MLAILAVGVTFVMRWYNRYWWDFIHAISVMWLVEVAIIRSECRWVKKALALLGEHSSNIFMLHTFFVIMYWSDFLYSFYYPLPIWLVLLGCSLACSVGLEWIKHVIHFDQLQKRIRGL